MRFLFFLQFFAVVSLLRRAGPVFFQFFAVFCDSLLFLMVCCSFLLLLAAFCVFSCFLLFFVRWASEASEQSERAKLSGACSGFPLLTHAFADVPLLSLASLPLLDNGLLAVSSFSCFTLRHMLQQP